MNAQQKEKIIAHGQSVLAIFPNAKERDPLALCKKLRRIETAARKNAEDYCNGVKDCDQWSRKAAGYKRKVIDLLGFPSGMDYCPIMVNGDPRGYALKLDDKLTRALWHNICQDMGGYGILAPDFD
jgi:hypothetical protein